MSTDSAKAEDLWHDGQMSGQTLLRAAVSMYGGRIMSIALAVGCAWLHMRSGIIFTRCMCE